VRSDLVTCDRCGTQITVRRGHYGRGFVGRGWIIVPVPIDDSPDEHLIHDVCPDCQTGTEQADLILREIEVEAMQRGEIPWPL
jgi:hypothetical protein